MVEMSSGNIYSILVPIDILEIFSHTVSIFRGRLAAGEMLWHNLSFSFSSAAFSHTNR